MRKICVLFLGLYSIFAFGFGPGCLENLLGQDFVAIPGYGKRKPVLTSKELFDQGALKSEAYAAALATLAGNPVVEAYFDFLEFTAAHLRALVEGPEAQEELANLFLFSQLNRKSSEFLPAAHPLQIQMAQDAERLAPFLPTIEQLAAVRKAEQALPTVMAYKPGDLTTRNSLYVLFMESLGAWVTHSGFVRQLGAYPAMITQMRGRSNYERTPGQGTLVYAAQAQDLSLKIKLTANGIQSTGPILPLNFFGLPGVTAAKLETMALGRWRAFADVSESSPSLTDGQRLLVASLSLPPAIDAVLEDAATSFNQKVISNRPNLH